MKITIIEGDDLAHLLRTLDTGPAEVFRLRVCQESDGAVKFKVNERTWTPGLGKKDGEWR